jgi:hypothetical protein
VAGQAIIVDNVRAWSLEHAVPERKIYIDGCETPETIRGERSGCRHRDREREKGNAIKQLHAHG